MTATREVTLLMQKCTRINSAALGTASRGMTALLPSLQDDLYHAASSIASTPNSRITIITGFYISRAEPPRPETDGPVGAIHLAGVLKDCGYDVEILTDKYCLPALIVAREAAFLDVQIKSLTDETAIRQLAKKWGNDEHGPSHLIAIERAGPGFDGRVRNMRGIDITENTAPLHLLFAAPSTERTFVTIGIGDGGNEIGMGKVAQALIAENVSLGAEIHCTTASDYLIPAGISNWGAGALAAAICLAKPECLTFLGPRYNVDTDMLIMRALARSGVAVDGVTGQVAQDTVDGIAEVITHEVIRSILRIALIPQQL